jgi:hypothetical protein
LLPDAAVEPAVAACTEAFASHGWAAPRFLRATAAGGARVVD